MAKNILLKDTDASPADKGTSSKRKKRGTKPQPDSKRNLAMFSQVGETWHDERTRSVAGLVSLGLALVFALAVVSSFFTGSLDIRILQNEGVTDELEAYHNVLGSLGAHIGFFLARQGLGLGALSIPFLLGLLGLRWLTDRPFLPLAKTLRLSAFLAMFVPWALAFLTHTAPEANQPAVSALNDHVTGAAGLWLLGQSLHWGGALGSSLFLMLTVGVMLAFNTPALWKRLGQRLGAWFKSSEETMMEEDAQDEAAVKEAASGDDVVASGLAAGAATGNVLLRKDESTVMEDDVPFEVSPEAETAPEPAAAESPVAAPEPEPEANPSANNVEEQVAAEPVEDEPVQAETAPATTASEDPGGEGDVEFEVKEVQEEETLSSEELEDLAEEFGEEYDPTLDLGRFQLPNLDKLVNHGDGKNRVTDEELQQNKENILRTLANFNIEVSKITAEVGPTVTLYEIVPAPGIRISKIKNLEDDIALSLAALGIRIVAPSLEREPSALKFPIRTRTW